MNAQVETDRYLGSGVFLPRGTLEDCDETGAMKVPRGCEPVVLFQFERANGRQFFIDEEGLKDRYDQRANMPKDQTELAMNEMERFVH